MNLWHALRREVTGAWRSVRYDLDTHRATRLAGAFTKEFERSTDAPRSRMVPLTGVALMLVGGGAGALLAISGGMAALTSDRPAVTDHPPAAASQTAAAAQPNRPAGATGPAAQRRPATRRTATASSPAVVVSPTGTPILENSSLPPSPSPTTTAPPSTSPSPSASPSSPGASSGAPDSRR